MLISALDQTYKAVRIAWMRFEVSSMIKIKIVVLGSHTFCPENGGSRFHQNIGNYLQNYEVS
jgi:hypothetical protein